MDLSHLPATFDALDALEVETLALFLTTDGRPLRGVAGLVDWRLCGALSTALQGGGLQGTLGERLLMPTQGRIGAQRLLVFGAGPVSSPLSGQELGRCLRVAQNAGASDLAMELPLNADAAAVVEALSGFSGRRLLMLGAPASVRDRLGPSGASKHG